MQGSNSVSNDVLWARIKKKRKKKETGRRYQRVCFTKMLLEKLFFQMKKRLLWWWQWWGIHVEITRECRENYTYIYIYMSSIYQRDTVFGYIVSGWERCFSGLCNCPVWLETDNILTDAYQTTSAVSALLMLLHPNTVHQIPPSKHPRSVKSPLTHHINSDLVWEKCHLTHIQCRIATANIC